MELLEFTLLPDDNLGTNDWEAQGYADKTYKLNLKSGHIQDMTQGLDGVKQAIYKILATEKGVFPIYSSDYGVALDHLHGLAGPVVESEIKRRITEALLGDDRIDALSHFSFLWENETLKTTFFVAANGEKVRIKWEMEGI